jgi:NitT/TauT family transport system permease protein
LTKILVIASGSFFPVAINTYAAVTNVNPVLIRAARNLGATEKQLFRHVLFPATLPGFYTGAVLGAGLSLILLVYAEMTAANSGVGYFTYTAATLFETEKAFAGVFTLGIFGWLWHRTLTLIESYHCPWRFH